MFLYSQLDSSALSVNPRDFYSFNDKNLEGLWAGKKMPMETFIEAYFDQKIDIKIDMHDLLRNHRKDLFKFNFTAGHIKYFLQKFLFQAVNHSKKWDFDDVSKTYNLGNDFYNWFLGDSMVYTSAIYNDNEASESLEQAQVNKMDIVGRKIDMRPGEKHLDIGCGWGTFIMHCAKNFGTDSYGITIAQEQIDHANDKMKKEEFIGDAKERCEIELRDYRDLIVPEKLYDKITCLEMAEHVGVKNFQKFMRQVKGLLQDDGLFYLQICGLRPSWQFEDLVWGLFMAKYIFPAADASCPISWVNTQMEQAGFEIHSVENVSVHYTETIHRWYNNWVKNEKAIIEKGYEVRLYRIWLTFLGWSVLIGEQGTSQCYQIVANKNRSEYNRTVWRGRDLANYLLKFIRNE